MEVLGRLDAVAAGKEPEPVRSAHVRREGARDLRRRIVALGGLPLRPASVRSWLARSEPPADSAEELTEPPLAELDPAWLLARTRGVDPLDLIAGRGWWPAEHADAVERLWRHAVATACAARRLASEAGRTDADRCFALGLLHRLGLWAVGAVEPAWLAGWLDATAERRREDESASLGGTVETLGRELAERWGTDPALADVAWLAPLPSGDLDAAAAEPQLVDLIRQAIHLAERTPWALSPARAPTEPTDARVRLLIAEVQIRCGGAFRDGDASTHEEALARSHAALRLRTRELERELAARDRFLRGFAAHDPADDPATWADRVALAWCSGPGVVAARVETADGPSATEAADRVVGLGRRGGAVATVRLRKDREVADAAEGTPLRSAWDAWADLVADRDRLASRLDALTDSLRRAEPDRRREAGDLLESLAEFAAGAGHELNNPLAVIQGRAQLLLARADAPDTVRSLRAIVGQAQRASRMLRDLIYAARPPAHRPRPCQPAELLRACVRDLQAEAEMRGVRLVLEADDSVGWAWLDPDPLRHAADVLARNALEATPAGGTVVVRSESAGDRLDWSVRDDGRGLDEREARHLFDPFFCGRQAGRGLGLGLARAARSLGQAGGELTWRSSPGHGTTFHVRLPLAPPPVAASGPVGPSTGRALPAV